jgi:tetratricopeptide (TPR) repeat protein
MRSTKTAAAPSEERDTEPFVGRDAELARLTSLLERALGGDAAVCFVTGPAGQGKTTLLRELLHRAEGADPELIVAVGECNAQTGAGDPYLPFREVMAVLTGDVESRLARGTITQDGVGRVTAFLKVSARSVIEAGPDLVGTFIPGGAFLTRVAAKLGRRVPWLSSLRELVEGGGSPAIDGTGREQARMFEQYTNVVKRMARERPLVLVLDDLQWADAGSTALLFHLVRRLGQSRVLIVGAYRAEDVEIGRAGDPHPLANVLQEIRRYFGDVWVDLSAADPESARRLVDGLVDAEPNRLGQDFREALLRRTDGHPLFAVELLRSLRDTGTLARDETGRWIEARAVDWDATPARVEGVIAGQIGRLEPELAEALTVAAVEGETFTAEVVARVRGVEERALVRQLSGTVERRHGLVVARESRVAGDRRISRYRFRHILFQKYLYGRLDPVERAYLHEDIARELEALHGDQTDDIALELAHHHAEAGHRDRAVAYLIRAGEAARRVFASQEAIGHFRLALELQPELDAATAARVHESLGAVLDLTGRYGAARTEIERALELLAAGDVIGRARLHCMLGKSLLPEPRPAESLAQFQTALEVLGPQREPEDTEWWDAWVSAGLDQIWTLYYLDRPDELEATAARIEPVVERLGDPRHRATLLQTSIMAAYRRDLYRISDRTLDLAREFVRSAEQVGDARVPGSITASVGSARFNLGFSHLWRREQEPAEASLRAAFAWAERAGDAFLQTLTFTYLAVLERQRGNEAGVGDYARRGRELAESTGMKLYVATADGNLAWLARREGRADEARALAGPASDSLEAAVTRYPFLWTALWPLAGIELDQGNIEAACRHVRRMTEPDQQRLPDHLDAAMREAVAALDRGNTEAAEARLRVAAERATELGYL